MKTRSFFLILILVFSASWAIAQSAGNAGVSFGILGGVNFQNLNGKDNQGDKLANDLLLSFHGGVNVQIPIAPEFFFQPGLMFALKGAKNTEGSITGKIKVSYIELPLNVVYKAMLGNGSIMIGFGPYFGYGIAGKVIAEGGSETVKTDIEFKNTVEVGDPLTVPYFRAIDAGGNVFVGYEMANGIFFQLDTQLGMLKINPEDKRITNDESSVKNTGFGLSLGYRF